MKRRLTLFWPLFLIAAGIIWLLVQAGNLPAANLWALTHVWPYFLIAAGLGIIFHSYWKYASILLDIVVIGGAVLTIIYAPQLKWDTPFMISTFANDQLYFGPGVPGSGKLVTEDRSVADFSSVRISYPAQVVISQGEAAAVKIEADDNLLPDLKTEVRDSQLQIFYKTDNNRHVNPTRPVKVTIIVKDLTSVIFDSAGELSIEKIKSDRLSVTLNGAGNLKLDNVTINDLSINLSGAGSMTASGTANTLDLNISGFGSFDGQNLHDKVASTNLSGAGSATLWVDQRLEAEISGAGSVNYYGAANVTKQISGIGGVNHVGNK